MHHTARLTRSLSHLPELHRLDIRNICFEELGLATFPDAVCALCDHLHELSIGTGYTKESRISEPVERAFREAMMRIAHSCWALKELKFSGCVRCDGQFFRGLACKRSIRVLRVFGVGHRVTYPMSEYDEFSSSVLDFARSAPLLETVLIYHDYGGMLGRDRDIKQQLVRMGQMKQAVFVFYMYAPLRT